MTAHPVRRAPLTTAVLVLAALAFLIPGLWAFVAPESFYTHIATFPPYNRHFMHDLGAFQLGVGAAVATGLWWRDGASVALAGATVGTVVHFVSHVLDRSLGGRPALDLWALGALSAVLLLTLAVRLREAARIRTRDAAEVRVPDARSTRNGAV
jgi:hypothetical protein